MKKSVVINAVQELPSNFKLDDLMEKLIVIEKIEAGLEDIRKGRVVSHNKVKKMVAKWRK
jgi:predicted transcriptional regulator